MWPRFFFFLFQFQLDPMFSVSVKTNVFTPNLKDKPQSQAGLAVHATQRLIGHVHALCRVGRVDRRTARCIVALLRFRSRLHSAGIHSLLMTQKQPAVQQRQRDRPTVQPTSRPADGTCFHTSIPLCSRRQWINTRRLYERQ